MSTIGARSTPCAAVLLRLERGDVAAGAGASPRPDRGRRLRRHGVGRDVQLRRPAADLLRGRRHGDHAGRPLVDRRPRAAEAGRGRGRRGLDLDPRLLAVLRHLGGGAPRGRDRGVDGGGRGRPGPPHAGRPPFSPSSRLPWAKPPGAMPAIVSRPHSASAPLAASPPHAGRHAGRQAQGRRRRRVVGQRQRHAALGKALSLVHQERAHAHVDREAGARVGEDEADAHVHAGARLGVPAVVAQAHLDARPQREAPGPPSGVSSTPLPPTPPTPHTVMRSVAW